MQDNRDIVESVDMEMSDDEEPQSQGQGPSSFMPTKLKPSLSGLLTNLHKTQINRKIKPEVRELETLVGGSTPSQSISFNIPVTNKILTESPLKEKEEPKKKLPLHKLNSSPPSKSVVEVTEMKPPPLPPISLNQEVESIATTNITSSQASMKKPLNDDCISRPVEFGDTNQSDAKKDSINKISHSNEPQSPFSPNKNIDVQLPNLNHPPPNFTNMLSGPNPNRNDLANKNQGDVVNNKTKEEQNQGNEHQVQEDNSWNPPANHPSSLLGDAPSLFRARLPPPPPPPPPSQPLLSSGPVMWRGPRRGMPPHRFRHPGNNGPPHQPRNFQPHMGRPPFRGNNNWRPRFNNW